MLLEMAGIRVVYLDVGVAGGEECRLVFYIKNEEDEENEQIFSGRRK